jgi:Holliday junction resolvase
MPNTNRRAGDYLERQAKTALVDLGWWCIRAAGSHGVADVVAMRAGSAPLFVACKTSGKIPPAERAALVDAAEKAGARPILASRERRGWISLQLVGVDGMRPFCDPLPAPKRAQEADDGDD